MNRLFPKLAAATALTALFLAVPAQASDESELLRDANTTVNALKHDPAFGTARTMLQNARAVYIVPKLVKGGFIFGAEGGEGVLLRRAGKGWSAPSFYDMGSASFGLQAGLEQAELVFIINSKRALRGIEKGEVKLGAGGGPHRRHPVRRRGRRHHRPWRRHRGLDVGDRRLWRPDLQWQRHQTGQGYE